ncbi:hypothetical protein VNI00_018961, partial [Paramarasmius palmivorus]
MMQAYPRLRDRKPAPKLTGHKGFDSLIQARYKAVLYFPTDDEPRLVRLERRRIDGFDFRPLLDPDAQPDGGTANIKGIHAEDSSEAFRLFYFEQTGRNGFPVNDSITRELEGFTDGLRRPWVGPVVVVWEDDEVLTVETVEEKAESTVTQIHNFYEDFVRDEGVPYDRLEDEDL